MYIDLKESNKYTRTHRYGKKRIDYLSLVTFDFFFRLAYTQTHINNKKNDLVSFLYVDT